MKISTEKLSHEIADKEGDEERTRAMGKMECMETYMSSKGEMKTSLRLMIWRARIREENVDGVKETDVFVLNVLEKFEFAISAFGEDRRAEGLHNLLDGNGCACELVLCGAAEDMWGVWGKRRRRITYHTSPNAPG
jgi:hypothetical protein